MCIIKFKNMRSFLEVTHITVVILKNHWLQLGSSDAAIFFKTDCFGSSSNITFLANIVYCLGSIVEDVAQCCGLVVQGYNITFDCSFQNRLLEDGW